MKFYVEFHSETGVWTGTLKGISQFCVVFFLMLWKKIQIWGTFFSIFHECRLHKNPKDFWSSKARALSSAPRIQRAAAVWMWQPLIYIGTASFLTNLTIFYFESRHCSALKNLTRNWSKSVQIYSFFKLIFFEVEIFWRSLSKSTAFAHVLLIENKPHSGHFLGLVSLRTHFAPNSTFLLAFQK